MGAFLSLSSSLLPNRWVELKFGVSEPRNILEVIHYKHIGVLGKAIEHRGI